MRVRTKVNEQLGVDRERSTTTIPGVSNSVFFRTKRARSGFYGDEPLIFGEHTANGPRVFFNREGVLSAWGGRWDGGRFRISFDISFDTQHYLTGGPGLAMHAWFWRYHFAAALRLSPRAPVVDRSRSTPDVSS